jgi:hypothetical protein
MVGWVRWCRNHPRNKENLSGGVGFVRWCRIGLWEEMWDFSANGAIENRLGSRSKLQRILERLVTLCAFVNVKCEPPRVYFPKFPKRFRFKSYSAYGLLSE